MAKVEVGRFSERLRRALGMKGQEIVSGELSPEISPVIILNDDSADQQFLQQIRLCSSAMIASAQVAQNSLFRIRNPLNSGVLALFSSISFSVDVTLSEFNMGLSNANTDLALAGATALRDNRWGGGANPTTLIASRGNNVAVALSQSWWVLRVLAGDEAKYTTPIVLLPNETLEIGTAVQNIRVNLTAAWSERQLPALEE